MKSLGNFFVPIVPLRGSVLVMPDFYPGTNPGTICMFVPFVPGWNKAGLTLVPYFVPHFHVGMFVRISARWKTLCLP